VSLPKPKLFFLKSLKITSHLLIQTFKNDLKILNIWQQIWFKGLVYD
jgi:hypothetical protein